MRNPHVGGWWWWPVCSGAVAGAGISYLPGVIGQVLFTAGVLLITAMFIDDLPLWKKRWRRWRERRH